MLDQTVTNLNCRVFTSA